jgi:scyllo-inositol 2-dehydrogenase (NADP+)
VDPIKTALCSFGMSGRVFHAPFLHLHKGFELYAVCERTKDLAFAKYPGIKTYRSLEALLNDAAIELVIVNTPNFTHFEYAMAALDAGKHVVVEKPFTVTTKQADDLITFAQQKNKKLTVYQNRRWDSDFQTVQKIVNEGLLGNIVELEIHFDRFSETLSPKQHKEIPGPGTGILYDLGSHLVDQGIQLCGMPEAVFCDLFIARPISKVEDYMEVILFYNSSRVRLKGSYQVREALPAFILHGSKGSFIKPRADTQEERLVKGETPDAADWGIESETGRGLLHTEVNGKVVREYINSERGNYMAFYDQLYKALRDNEPLPVTAEDGRKVIHVIEKGYQSQGEKRIVTFI